MAAFEMMYTNISFIREQNARVSYLYLSFYAQSGRGTLSGSYLNRQEA